MAVVPVSCLLSLKAVAAALGGSVPGRPIRRWPSVSPATSSAGSARWPAKLLPTVIDESAELFEKVYVSGAAAASTSPSHQRTS